MLVAFGLGNPGEMYEGTRHNVGKQVVLSLISDLGLKPRPGKGRYSYASDASRDLVLVVPSTYMNTSGEAASQVLEHLGAATGDLLVVCDDFALPTGMVRIRKQGSDGGHNGLASIIYSLGSEAFPRLRIGIGPVRPGIDPANFVLSHFEAVELQSVETACRDACEAVLTIASGGLDRAMNAYNKRVEAPGSDPGSEDGGS